MKIITYITVIIFNFLCNRKAGPHQTTCMGNPPQFFPQAALTLQGAIILYQGIPMVMRTSSTIALYLDYLMVLPITTMVILCTIFKVPFKFIYTITVNLC